MSDLAEKLRDMHALAADACDPEYNRLLLEAADEIERLRAENSQMWRTLDSIAWEKWTPAAEAAQQTIRKIEQARKG